MFDKENYYNDYTEALLKECKLHSGSLYGKSVYDLIGYPLETPNRYLDASVCVKHFYEMAETWWFLYETFSKCSYKNVCLKEYCKWRKYAEIFGKTKTKSVSNKNYIASPRAYGKTQTLIKQIIDTYDKNRKPIVIIRRGN